MNINKSNKIIADLVFQIEKTVELKDYHFKNKWLYYDKKSKNCILVTCDDENDYSDGYPIDLLNIDTHQTLITKNTYCADTCSKLNFHL